MSVVAPVPRGTVGARMGRGVVDWIPAVLVLVLGILLWEGLVRALDVQRFLLPAPSAILDTLWERAAACSGRRGSTRSPRRSAAG